MGRDGEGAAGLLHALAALHKHLVGLPRRARVEQLKVTLLLRKRQHADHAGVGARARVVEVGVRRHDCRRARAIPAVVRREVEHYYRARHG